MYGKIMREIIRSITNQSEYNIVKTRLLELMETDDETKEVAEELVHLVQLLLGYERKRTYRQKYE